MKKSASLIIVAVVALAVGYLLGAHVGSGNSSQTKGDINAVNVYRQLLIAPEYLAFNEEMADNPEVLDQTISSLQIVERRIADYATLAGMMATLPVTQPETAAFVEPFLKAEAKGHDALNQAAEALQAANQLKAGKEVDSQKALEDAEGAMSHLDEQIAMGKLFVEGADQYLSDKNLKDNLLLATLRDLVASHCSLNASLTQNDSEIDYWQNIRGLLNSQDMAFTLE